MDPLTNQSIKLMNKLKTLLVLAALVVSALPLAAQTKRVSPHDTISAVIDGSRVTVTYGRPYTKDPRSGEARKIWGGLVPYGKVWRLGADEATTLITEKPLVMGDVTVPAGAYSLYLLPNEDGTAKLIVNKEIGQWGTKYEEKEDLARVDLKKDALDAPVDELALSITKNSSGGGLLKVSWESTQYSVAFNVQK